MSDATIKKPQKGDNERSGIVGHVFTVLVMILIAACVVGISRVRGSADANDFAMANVMTVLLVFLAVVAAVVRALFWPGVTGGRRWSLVAVTVAIVALLCGILRIDRVSGRLVPTVRLRWAPKPDELLRIPIARSAKNVDLANSTELDFPQFLGPGRNLHYDRVVLDADWATHAPKQLWREKIGAGWSGFSAVNGYAVTMEQRGKQELTSCYEVATGELRWSHAVATRHETLMGGVGPRCTPTIDEGFVYAFGATAVLRCIDGATGKLVWDDDLLARYDVEPGNDSKAVAWGRSASPLIVDDLVVIPLGGPAGGPCRSLLALDKKTGEERWTSGDRQVSYASPSVMTLAGRRQIVIVNEDTVSGHEIADGRELWSFPWEGSSVAAASASQAVAVSTNRLLLSKDYGQGAELLELTAEQDGLTAETVWKKSSVLKTKFTNVVVVGDHAYGLSDGILECVDVLTGERQWKDRRKGDFGHGQVLAVGKVLLVQAESGEVAMVALDPEAYRILGRFEALTDQTWNNLCLYGNKLLVRNAGEAACYELPLVSGS